MNNDNIHTEQETFEGDTSKELFGKTEIEWGRSKGDIWAQMEGKLDSEQKTAEPVAKSTLKLNWFKMSMAASIIFLMGLSFFFYNYTERVYTSGGEQLSHILPDGSIVEVNAGSVLSYKPYWWKVNRSVTFEGEGFFKVQKGERFEVKSLLGITSVLGTSFVVRTRDEEYQVTCFTGKVKVEASETQNAVIIHPNEQASLSRTGQLAVEKGNATLAAKAWLDNKFVFTAKPLVQVFSDLELAYGIIVDLPPNLDLRFTGNFEKNADIEFVLKLICRPMQLQYEKKANNRYEITQR